MQVSTAAAYPHDAVQVMVDGWCELGSPLTLDNPTLDSNIAFVGSGPGAGLSGGVELSQNDTNTQNASEVTTVDLSKYNFTVGFLFLLSSHMICQPLDWQLATLSTPIPFSRRCHPKRAGRISS
jgi:hypothetical protein